MRELLPTPDSPNKMILIMRFLSMDDLTFLRSDIFFPKEPKKPEQFSNKKTQQRWLRRYFLGFFPVLKKQDDYLRVGRKNKVKKSPSSSFVFKS
jgi:hypothetical protein